MGTALGPGSESNLRLMPFVVQMAIFLLSEEGAQEQRAAMEATLRAFVDSPVDAPTYGPDGDTAPYHLVSTLVLQSSAQFAEARLPLLRHLVAHAMRQLKRSGAPPPYDATAHAALRPWLVMFAMVDLLHTEVLRPDAEPAAAADPAVPPTVARMELLRNQPGVVLARCQKVRGATSREGAACQGDSPLSANPRACRHAHRSGSAGGRRPSGSRTRSCRWNFQTSFTMSPVRRATSSSLAFGVAAVPRCSLLHRRRATGGNGQPTQACWKASSRPRATPASFGTTLPPPPPPRPALRRDVP